MSLVGVHPRFARSLCNLHREDVQAVGGHDDPHLGLREKNSSGGSLVIYSKKNEPHVAANVVYAANTIAKIFGDRAWLVHLRKIHNQSLPVRKSPFRTGYIADLQSRACAKQHRSNPRHAFVKNLTAAGRFTSKPNSSASSSRQTDKPGAVFPAVPGNLAVLA